MEYLTRLEQGRDRRPSPQVLAALADALRLTPTERVHLFQLTKAADPGFTCVLRLAHPDTDVLRLAYEALELSPDDGLRLLVYLPADSATAAALDRVTRPARSLHLVAG